LGLLKKKSLEEILANSENGDSHLNRTLTSTDLIMLGIGVVIGAGLFSITGVAAAQHAGPAIVISFIIAAIGCAFAGLCYSELASMIPVSGSAYTYAYATMGELVAWIIGWDLILEYAIGAATVSISWSAYMVSFLHDLGIHLPPAITASPWQSVQLPNGGEEYGIINLPALFIIVCITWLLIVGVRETTRVNMIIVCVKLAVVLLFISLGFHYINQENYHPFIPPNTGVFGEFGWSGIMRAAGIVFFAYVGFDSLSTASQEAINPQKSMPIGIIGSLFICTLLYVLFAHVLTGIVNYTELNTAAPVAVAIDKTPYLWIQGLVKIAILAGFTSVILVLLYGQSRIFYIMARDGMLPKWFSTIHPTYKTPWYSNILLMLFVGLFGAFAPIALVGSMTSIGTLLAFVLVCVGVLILRYTNPEQPRPFRTPWVPLVPILGIVFCLALMFSLGLDNWMRLFIWLLIGFVIYFGYSRRHIVYNDVN
jgi:APA family basic amino acid/polyamine antiporter